MDRLFMAVATGLGLGKIPFAPGTWGTLLAFPIHYLISSLSPAGYWLSLAGIIIVAIFTAGSAEKIMDKPDPGAVVIDEVAGMLVALIHAPPTVVAWLAAFLLFRFFDIVKPFPVNFFDQRFHGGLGIVLDDLMAGIYALLCLQILYRFVL
ncbi:MAG: phosphatidylglycerophosphatase A [Proteobacteria bacterium]|nr:phosphatidylglycerophosphatase A [Pseudomonadota bacterium]MBU1736795.1 phosphatidylglycerophosphatase A [Pseudomonadota bacterium]